MTHDDQLKQAMDFFLNNSKYSIWALENCFEVLHSTLQNWLAGSVPCSEEITSQCHLSLTETKVLAEHTAEMQKLHFLLMPQDIRLRAQAETHGDKMGVNYYSQVLLKDNPEMVNYTLQSKYVLVCR